MMIAVQVNLLKVQLKKFPQIYSMFILQITKSLGAPHSNSQLFVNVPQDGQCKDKRAGEFIGKSPIVMAIEMETVVSTLVKPNDLIYSADKCIHFQRTR